MISRKKKGRGGEGRGGQGRGEVGRGKKCAKRKGISFPPSEPLPTN